MIKLYYCYCIAVNYYKRGSQTETQMIYVAAAGEGAEAEERGLYNYRRIFYF